LVYGAQIVNRTRFSGFTEENERIISIIPIKMLIIYDHPQDAVDH
jgi:hypothetical protein